MARPPREDVGGEIYHCLNRANARMQIFFERSDYVLFEDTLRETIEIFETNVLAYCVMPNHFHLIIETKRDGELAEFMRWLTLTHTQRWHKVHQTVGSGHVYQGRYKSFRITGEQYLYTALRYVERNPIEAGLSQKALEWPYSSVYKRYIEKVKWLADWPIPEPSDYLQFLELSDKDDLSLITTPH